MESLKTRLCCSCIYKRCISVVLCIFQEMSGKRRADGYGRRRGNARPRWQAIIIVCLCLCIWYMIWPSGSKDNLLVNTVPNEDFYEQHTKTALRISSNYAPFERAYDFLEVTDDSENEEIDVVVEQDPVKVEVIQSSLFQNRQFESVAELPRKDENTAISGVKEVAKLLPNLTNSVSSINIALNASKNLLPSLLNKTGSINASVALRVPVETLARLKNGPLDQMKNVSLQHVSKISANLTLDDLSERLRDVKKNYDALSKNLSIQQGKESAKHLKELGSQISLLKSQILKVSSKINVNDTRLRADY